MISLRPLTRIGRDQNRRWFNSEQTCLSRAAVDIDFSNSEHSKLVTPGSPSSSRPRLRLLYLNTATFMYQSMTIAVKLQNGGLNRDQMPFL